MLWWYLRQIKSNDASKRLNAVKNLSAYKGTKTFDVLLQCLKDEDFEVRAAAAKRLGQIKDRRAIDPLIMLLSDPYSIVRNETLKALAWIGLNDERIRMALIASLKDEDLSVRKLAAQELEYSNTEEAKAAIKEYTKYNIKKVKELSKAEQLKYFAEEKEQREILLKRIPNRMEVLKKQLKNIYDNSFISAYHELLEIGTLEAIKLIQNEIEARRLKANHDNSYWEDFLRNIHSRERDLSNFNLIVLIPEEILKKMQQVQDRPEMQGEYIASFDEYVETGMKMVSYAQIRYAATVELQRRETFNHLASKLIQ